MADTTIKRGSRSWHTQISVAKGLVEKYLDATSKAGQANLSRARENLAHLESMA